ncbi:MAG: phospholipase [Planctomycetaceae bacterium]|nr:phospholipase [Planctomycetaceae bacterium]
MILTRLVCISLENGVLNWPVVYFLLAFVSLAFSISVTLHAVLHKRDVRSVIGWVGLAWFTPVLGSLAYLVLGINRIHRKASTLKIRESWNKYPDAELNSHDLEQVEIVRKDFPNIAGLAAAGHHLSKLQLKPGNSVEPLVDGDEAYPAMLEAIGAATSSVALLSYIFDCDRVGVMFEEALVAAQQRGVEVRVLVDDVGSKYSKPNMVRRLRAAGLKTTGFLPAQLPRLPKYANMRNHRKILVVDGQVGFTGGTNIREGHCLEMAPDFPVQCLHFILRGPVVRQLSRVFAIDWAFATGEELSGDTWFPKIDRVGEVWARGIEHGPDEQFERLTDLIAAALASAQQRVRIVTPYFLPHSSLIQSLNAAALRNVEVEIYIPAHNNITLVQWACTAQLWQNLEKGCRVFTTPDPFDHTKVMIVDDIWSLIGSTNWDPRSLRLNFEFNVECYSPDFAMKLNQIIDGKAETASEITLADVNARRLPIRLRDGLARLASPYL